MLGLYESRVFFQLIPLVDTGDEDHLTSFRIYRHDVTNETVLIGLPAIQSSGKYRYMVPVTLEDPVQRSFRLASPNESPMDDTLLLYVDWDIQFA